MNKKIKEKIEELVEDLGYEVEDIKEITNHSEVQEFIYELEDEEYEIPGPIEKFYLVKTTEDGVICKVPVIDGEIEEELVLECNEELNLMMMTMMMRI
ncbi:MAG: hypothetical protein ACLVH9_03790 [Fusobacterium sp.]|uniref:hypothetical protein n=1 Tax=Fusobacterium sp. TaxID=68766 RepID=UPI00399BBEE0